MDEKTINKLTSSKEIRTFTAYVLTKMDNLNSLNGMEGKTAEDIAIEVKARSLAFYKIKEIMEPFLQVKKDSIKFDKKEYQM